MDPIVIARIYLYKLQNSQEHHVQHHKIPYYHLHPDLVVITTNIMSSKDYKPDIPPRKQPAIRLNNGIIFGITCVDLNV